MEGQGRGGRTQGAFESAPQHLLVDFGNLLRSFDKALKSLQWQQKATKKKHQLRCFSSTSLQNHTSPPPLPSSLNDEVEGLSTPSKSMESERSGRSRGWIKQAVRGNVEVKAVMKEISVAERALIGAGAGGIAGAFTYVCLHPLDTVKTKLQTRGAAKLYNGTLDVIAKVLKNQGILGFYSGVSAVLVGSTISSAIYFGTCELGKSVLSKIHLIPAIAIPPAAGAMGNLVSSAVMVPKELITQRMQAGAAGRSWEVLLRTLETEGIRGLYAGYSATILRNLPAGVLSFSSFEYSKAAVLRKTKQPHLEPFQSVCCGAFAGAISALLTTPLDVVKTRLMTQARSGALMDGEMRSNIALSAYKGITSTVKQIWCEEGWMGLTRGVGPRVLHSSCFAALGYFAFETARLTLLSHYLAQKAEVFEGRTQSNDVLVNENISSHRK